MASGVTLLLDKLVVLTLGPCLPADSEEELASLQASWSPLIQRLIKGRFRNRAPDDLTYLLTKAKLAVKASNAPASSLVRLHSLVEKMHNHPGLKKATDVFYCLTLLKNLSAETAAGDDTLLEAFLIAGGSECASLTMRDLKTRGEEITTPQNWLGLEARSTGSGSTSESAAAAKKVLEHTFNGTTEARLIKDLLYALQAVDTEAIYCDHQARVYRVSPTVAVSPSVEIIIARLSELGHLYRYLCEIVNNTLEADKHGSLVMQAFAQCIRGHLVDFYHLLAVLDSNTKEDRNLSPPGGNETDDATGLTLRRLLIWLQEPAIQMRVLVDLVTACRGLKGGSLLSTIYGDVDAQRLVNDILQQSLIPLWKMIHAWMEEGVLRDPFEEFFVVEDSHCKAADLWRSRWFLDARIVPSFISLRLARQILLTGKSVSFVRHCCEESDWLEFQRNVSDAGLGDGPENPAFARQGGMSDLAGIVARAAAKKNLGLVELLLDKYNLIEHCKTMRQFLLLGQGDFVCSLIDIAESALSVDACNLQKHALISLVESAIRQSNAQFLPSDHIRRVDVQLMEPSLGETGWDVFALTYHVSPPLDVLLTPDSMTRIQKMFVFLWRLKRVSHFLATCWSHQIAAAGSSDLQQSVGEANFQKCQLLRMELSHLVHHISSYVMYEVIEGAWKDLCAALPKCTDLDAMIAVHDKYLDCLEESMFLSDSYIDAISPYDLLMRIFNLALRFVALQEGMWAHIIDVLMMPTSDDEIRAVPQGMVEELTNMSLEVRQLILEFLRCLEKKSEDSANIRSLTTRLDFNEYYLRQTRTMASDGGLWDSRGEK
eukprot:GHVL01022644.1.p1 GENE.GHVL01022644.1~~GHVL01022644.1.p1  ORF type:complete len:827 (+),score=139.23 GHVL01022644.1:127-2607(+)